ncbi:uncharacterized protein isoform X2 [Takifugu rubripes]|uniref:uncharacterized protein isoform X2 n=1 Tax=Takifugu rubripes TaxID=31033 RepID=UPI00114610DE|nr:uncharacterized protein LOC115250251 isoform X2 [Takifugu rubripes]
MGASGVSTRETFSLPLICSVPDVSLARSHKDEWKDIGPWTRLCEEATDWEQTHDPKVLFSPSLHVYCTGLVHCCSSHANSSRDPGKHNSDSELELSTVPDCVWPAHKYNVGLIRNCEPRVVTPKSTHRPRRAQYPLRKEAIEGIQPVFDSLLAAGVIVPCPNSPVNSPSEESTAHRRRPRNGDLSNAFFSVPVHPDSQYWFAFQFRGRGYTFTRMPQGYLAAAEKSRCGLQRPGGILSPHSSCAHTWLLAILHEQHTSHLSAARRR